MVEGATVKQSRKNYQFSIIEIIPQNSTIFEIFLTKKYIIGCYSFIQEMMGALKYDYLRYGLLSTTNSKFTNR